MKSWKKLLVLLLALVTVFALAACNKEEPEETEPTLNPGDKNCEHVFTEWEVTKENSCTKKGKQERECEKCGKEEEEDLLAFGHTFFGGECSVCGKEAKECEHPEVDTVVMSEATCTEDGVERKVCKLCKAVVDYNYVSAFWHPETETVVVREATCTEDGKEQEICKLCDQVVYEHTLWATGHEDTEYVVVTAPTCTEDGTYQYICTLCGEVDYGGTIWSEGHSYEYINAKAPTCTEIGWYNYRHCTVCDYLYNYEERPATGHSYSFGACGSCGDLDTSFQIVTVPGTVNNTHTVAQSESVAYDAVDAVIDVTNGEIQDKTTVCSYEFTAAIDGRYRVWLEEIYNNYYIKLYVYNAYGERVANDATTYNNEGLYMDLDAGVYTVELRYGNGLTTFNLNIGYHKTPVDISGYDVVNDKMEFFRQVNEHTFVPEVTGLYYFYLSEMHGNAEMSLRIRNRLNEEVAYNGYIGNGEGISATLNAGETYTLFVGNYHNNITPYVLHIGKQTPTVVIDGYNHIQDHMEFKQQTNIYEFVATGIDCRIDAVDMLAGMEVDIYLYNHLGERCKYETYCANGEGFNYSGLVPGQKYTVKVIYRNGAGSYTLRVMLPKEAVEVTENSAAVDSIEYNGQVNNYCITAAEDGSIVIRLRVDSYSNNRYLSFYVYDADGNRLTYDDYVYSGDSITIKNAVAGQQYTLRVTSYSGTMEYAISFE